jgi:O-antigen/teichoic acid export membrane protein
LNRLDRFSNLVRTLLLTGGAQATIQLLGFCAGLVAIRGLAPEQFALYTIAIATLGSMAVLTDSGTTSSVMAEGAKVWTDRVRFGAVLASGIHLRRLLALLALPIALPLLAVLLLHQGASWQAILTITAAVTVLFLVTASGQLLEVVPRLHQDLLPLQRIQLESAVGRLALMGLLIPLLPVAALAIACAALPQWWSNWRLGRLAGARVSWMIPGKPEIRRQLLRQVTRTMPGVLYATLSGQLSIWLISIFGRSADVATVGALGRLAMVLVLVGSMMSLIAIPRFARIAGRDHALILRRYWQIQGLCVVACVLPVAAIAIYPEQALAILGRHYSGLGSQAVLMAASSAIASIGGVAYILGTSRGVVAPPVLHLPYSIGIQGALIFLLPLDTVSGVIWVALLGQASQWVLHTVYFLWSSSRSTRSAN